MIGVDGMVDGGAASLAETSDGGFEGCGIGGDCADARRAEVLGGCRANMS